VRAILALCVVALLIPSCAGCPDALLSGTLARGDDNTAVVLSEFGEQAVEWPFGYSVQTEPDFALSDLWGRVVASEGDPIYVGGGSSEDDSLWIACGYVSGDPPR
jgi:hypothetical protein